MLYNFASVLCVYTLEHTSESIEKCGESIEIPLLNHQFPSHHSRLPVELSHDTVPAMNTK